MDRLDADIFGMLVNYFRSDLEQSVNAGAGRKQRAQAVLQYIRRARTQSSPAPDSRLAFAIEGGSPADNPGRLELAERAYDAGYQGTAVRLWREAFEANPTLVDDIQVSHRYNAACSAALAAAGRSKDLPAADRNARRMYRQQANEWLTAELGFWGKLLESGRADQNGYISSTMRHWLEDPDLAPFRDPASLAQLADDERRSWATLWDGVTVLLRKTNCDGP
jgi:hypothetical protein